MLERLKIEQVVDVFQAIKAMRIPRPGLVKTAVGDSIRSQASHTPYLSKLVQACGASIRYTKVSRATTFPINEDILLT